MIHTMGLMPYKDLASRNAWKSRNKDRIAASSARHYQRKIGALEPYVAPWANDTPEQRAERKRLRHLKSSRKRQAKGYFRQWWKAQTPAYKAERDKARRRRPAMATTIKALFIAQGGRCNGCETALGMAWNIDHIVPVARGGKTTDGNLQILCAPCNGKKSVNSMEFFKARMWFPTSAAP